MKKATFYATVLTVLIFGSTTAQSQTIPVNSFDKVIISPHVQVTFQEGDSESVSIESSTVSEDKVNIEVNGKTLRIYLEGAKDVTKSEEVYENGKKRNRSIYRGTVLIATVTYTNLKELSLRGEETFVCRSPLNEDKFRLKTYGESQVYLNEVKFDDFQATMYGESYLEIKSGTIGHQKYTVYGESEVNTLGANNKTTKVTAYGEGNFKFNVSERLKVTAYGEATVAYEGNPEVDKGLVIGEATIKKI